MVGIKSTYRFKITLNFNKRLQITAALPIQQLRYLLVVTQCSVNYFNNLRQTIYQNLNKL